MALSKKEALKYHPLRWLMPEDIILVFFLVLFLVVKYLFEGKIYVGHVTARMPFYALLLMIAFSLVTKARSLIRTPSDQRLRFLMNYLILLRDWVPFIILYAVYENFHDMTNLIHGEETLDRALARMDEIIFNVQPTLWLQRITHPLLTDMLSFCYTLYIILPSILLLILYMKNRFSDFRETVLALIIAVYMGLTGYILVPAIGPRAILDVNYTSPMHLAGIYFYNPFSALWNDLQSFQRDCFPSMHTAVSSIVLFSAYQYADLYHHRRIVFWLMLPFVLGLWFSTVYLRYHWVIDVFAGWAVSIAAMWLAKRIDASWAKLRLSRGLTDHRNRPLS